MHLSKTTWIAISGVIWFIVGIGLLTLGFNFIVFKTQLQPEETTSLIAFLSSISGGREKAGLVLITIGLIVGFLKGRFVLGKRVRKVVERIIRLQPPIRFYQVYSKGYLLLLCSMVLLGMSMKWLHLPLDVRGFVDVAIGSALMNGAMAYFRIAMLMNKELKKEKN